ncbi:MAG TPA: group II intron reverse transcriptase/maturase [Streptosporangiaceae bacterium]|nr:group II intron reverse transcriptase/maturase [Streptosporangiaceae bacterium]
MNAPAANATLDKVRDLQDKLYQAAERSPSRRFHALYDKVRRPDFLWRAWVDVARNGGAPGVDGVSIAQIEERGVEGVRAFLDELASELEHGTYRPLPVRRVTIPKPTGGERHLGVPAIRDRVVQASAKLVLEPIFEADFLDCSFGFRPGRSAHQALDAIRSEVNRGRVWVVDADIASFFDSIRPDVLRQALEERISDRRVLQLLMGWLRSGVWTGKSLIHPETGTSQGGVISPLMANVVLHRLDRCWHEQHRRLGVLVRYADDLVILCPTKERAEQALATLAQILAEMGLQLAYAKTSLVDLQEPKSGFVFLGFHHRRVESFTRKGRYFCARWPSKRAVERAKERIRSQTARRWLMLPVEYIVERLNLFLRGWRGYFANGNSTTVFHDLDEFVTERLARFITKKHGHHGRNYGLRVVIDHQHLGLVRLVGSVRHGAVHAVP